MSGNPIGHTQNNATLGVLVAVLRSVHVADYDSRTVHIRNNQYFVTSVAVLVHSAAELVAIDFRRQ